MVALLFYQMALLFYMKKDDWVGTASTGKGFVAGRIIHIMHTRLFSESSFHKYFQAFS
jgi:hypothetical protein